MTFTDFRCSRITFGQGVLVIDLDKRTVEVAEGIAVSDAAQQVIDAVRVWVKDTRS